MRFLIDNALSPQLARGLTEDGHDAVHVRDLGLRDADDLEIFQLAVIENRIIVSADTDFGMILAKHNQNRPSVILFRKGSARRPEAQLQIMRSWLSKVQDELSKGCVIVIEERRIRIRSLPFFGED